MRKDKGMEKLAEAMSKLADRLEKFQDPVLWQKVMNDAIRGGLDFGRLLPPGLGLPIAGPPVGTVEGVSITVGFSDEERSRLATQVYEAVAPQLQDFNLFVKESLKEMPPHRLKALAESIERGEKASIERRSGCIYIKAGGTEAYLGL